MRRPSCGPWRHLASRLGEHQTADVFAQFPITFPLSFVKELISRGLLREVRLDFLLLQQIGWFITSQTRLQEEDPRERM